MKRILITVILFFSTLLFYTSYASSYNFTVEPETVTVKPGDEISVTLKISDIDAGTEGINVVETTLQYDDSIIESVAFVDKNNWKSTYNPTEGTLHGKLLYTKMVSGVTADEDIGILKIKIKDTIQDSFSTEVKLLQVTSNDGFSLLNAGDKIVTLNYTVPKPEPKPEPNEPTTNKPTTNEPTTPDTPKTDSSSTVEQSSNTKETPEKNASNHGAQTGDIIWFVSIILTSCILLYLMIIFIMIKRSKDEEKEEDNDKKETK